VVATPIAAGVLALAILGGRTFQQVRNERWARATAILQPVSTATATIAPNAWTVTGPNRWNPGCGKYGIMGDGEIRRSPPT